MQMASRERNKVEQETLLIELSDDIKDDPIWKNIEATIQKYPYS